MTQPPFEPALDLVKTRAQTTLERAVGEGRLTLDEFTDKVDLVFQATDEAGVQAVVGTLPAPLTPATTVVSRQSIFDDVARGGRFALPTGATVSSFFGDVELDLRQAVITDPLVEVHTWSWFGDIEVTVPEGVEVEVKSGLIFGDEVVELADVPPVPGAPKIRIKAWTTFGDVRVVSAA
ncbi:MULTISPECIES: LiaF domain-containing protein [unclassified Crossiella]|uniref:DUF1707 SHOCT-like domain-containing protein n=1 Tax=unclassified Crossiella TaxID=2620835 RepID=UPI0020003982|nr:MULTISPECIES: LiaF domain-containing protein [unclassified Crossiella]MCK2237628.1 LiaF-related protein [Crossiella sp. S99.2]MCK2254914.1 LiaF-related protein [Crossiella sp. S99.1]